jgi:hypothetical protein
MSATFVTAKSFDYMHAGSHGVEKTRTKYTTDPN